jgi:hypothetical protein
VGVPVPFDAVCRDRRQAGINVRHMLFGDLSHHLGRFVASNTKPLSRDPSRAELFVDSSFYASDKGEWNW